MAHRTDAAATAAGVPGLRLRPYAGVGDLADFVRVTNSEYAADGIRAWITVDEMAAVFGHPSEAFDAARDVILAEVDGRVVGVGRAGWIDATDGVREYGTRGAVEPAFRRRGIGRALHRANVANMRRVAAAHDVTRPKVLGTWTSDETVGAGRLAESEGFSAVRWFFSMERPGLDRDLPGIPPLADGIEVRAVTREQARAIWEADHDAFQDHWGGWDTSDASFHRWADGPEWQPDNFVVAWDGDEVAAAVLNVIYPEENERLGIRRGWLESVFTRRAWRNRGLAKALIARSLHLLAQRGLNTAALGVDADNPSGALRLYESFGFVVFERGTAWRKPLEAAS
jgi:mycothiol synthase